MTWLAAIAVVIVVVVATMTRSPILRMVMCWLDLGVLSLYFFLPLVTLTNGFVDYVICMALFVGLYYSNG